MKTIAPFQEAVAFFCLACDALLHSVEFVATVPQRKYWDTVVEFNDSVPQRTCDACGTVAEPVDLAEFAWNDVADALTP